MLVTEPQGAAPPLHVHRDADETFYVLEGNVTFYAGGAEIAATASDFVFVRRGSPHTFLVRSEQARMLVTFGPAGVEGFFTALGIDAHRAHNPPAPAPPDPELFATVAGRFGMDMTWATADARVTFGSAEAIRSVGVELDLTRPETTSRRRRAPEGPPHFGD